MFEGIRRLGSGCKSANITRWIWTSFLPAMKNDANYARERYYIKLRGLGIMDLVVGNIKGLMALGAKSGLGTLWTGLNILWRLI